MATYNNGSNVAGSSCSIVAISIVSAAVAIQGDAAAAKRSNRAISLSAN